MLHFHDKRKRKERKGNHYGGMLLLQRKDLFYLAVMAVVFTTGHQHGERIIALDQIVKSHQCP
jgi:hypothetical protein